MGKRIDAGSLVGMGRRKVKGQGIVLERVKNVNLYAEFDLSDAWHKLYNKKHPEYLWKDKQDLTFLWQMRQDSITGIKETVKTSKPEVDAKLLKEFFSYNTAHGYQKGGNKIIDPKIDFCLVKWYKSPSDYGDTPSHWYNNRTCWTPTNVLKNL